MCFYYINKDSLHSLLAIYVDDNIVAGPETFKKMNDKIPKPFGSKPRE